MRINLIVDKNFVIYVKINLIVILEYIGKFEIIIIMQKNTEVLHILHAIYLLKSLKYFNKDLVKRFASTYKFYGWDINMFCLMLRKGIYPNKHLDSRQKFNKTVFADKKEFCSNLKHRRHYKYKHRRHHKYWLQTREKKFGKILN